MKKKNIKNIGYLNLEPINPCSLEAKRINLDNLKVRKSIPPKKVPIKQKYNSERHRILGYFLVQQRHDNHRRNAYRATNYLQF